VSQPLALERGKQMVEDVKKEEVQVGETSEKEDEEFINSLLGEEEGDPEETEEEKAKREEELQKNKNAEEARKRREAEAKKKLEEEAKAKLEAEAKAKLEEEKAKLEAEAKEKAEKTKESNKEKETQKEEKIATLGEQISKFKEKYPNVELKTLDNDKAFRKYIDGKLLAKKSFTELYEEFIDFKSEITMVEKETIEKNYIKSNSSAGPLKSNPNDVAEVYTEQELEEITRKMPTMRPSEVDKIYAKFKKSVSYYENKK
jgi:hypothetical protein